MIFFFQAEDGIRDYKVTGVQTCALPISHDRAQRRRQGRRVARAPARRDRALPAPHRRRPAGGEAADAGAPARSEERRVGKEWRSRWERDGEVREKRKATAVVADEQCETK